MSVMNTSCKRLADCADDPSTGADGEGSGDHDDWEELPVLLQSDDVSDLIRVAHQQGVAASTLAGSILREFLRQPENYARGRRFA